jgi:integrase
VIAPTAAKHYKTALKTLEEFNPGLTFNDITLEFYNDYIDYLNGKGLSLNTVGDHIKRIKSVMAASLEAGHHRNSSFKGRSFIKPSEDAENIFLSIAELKEIENIDLSNTLHLDRTRDLFLIGCYTSLRFSDYSRLTPKHIAGGFITIQQVKTGQDVVIPVHSVVRKILKKYNGNLPPAISNQKFNDYIKDVCKQVKSLQAIESKTTTKAGSKVTVNSQKWEMVASHTARRSFATNEYLAGTPTLTIMAVTGHRTERAFLKYIKVSKKEEAVRMAQGWKNREDNLKAV